MYNTLPWNVHISFIPILLQILSCSGLLHYKNLHFHRPLPSNIRQAKREKIKEASTSYLCWTREALNTTVCSSLPYGLMPIKESSSTKVHIWSQWGGATYCTTEFAFSLWLLLIIWHMPWYYNFVFEFCTPSNMLNFVHYKKQLIVVISYYTCTQTAGFGYWGMLDFWMNRSGSMPAHLIKIELQFILMCDRPQLPRRCSLEPCKVQLVILGCVEKRPNHIPWDLDI